jgi:beta-galactosidase
MIIPPRIVGTCLVLSMAFNAALLSILPGTAFASNPRRIENFCKGWKFILGDVRNGQEPGIDDSLWRVLDLPHDWSIEGKFSKDNPATPGGGALPGGIGWYRKEFTVPEAEKNRLAFIDFDGVYRNSEVWINGHYLGKRPYGYISFRYELTPFLFYGKKKNILAVRVDNSQQPNSRWYSGSGIYRNVWLVSTERISADHWGTYITTSSVTERSAEISVQTKIRNASGRARSLILKIDIVDQTGKTVASMKSECKAPGDSMCEIIQHQTIENPSLWSIENPYLYKAVTTVECDGKMYDKTETNFGIRSFSFDVRRGFILNGKQVKIKGVCDHHDLGCLGTAVNTRAIERQLEILKAMGCNGIRTSHNPPAPELLDLCDRMGFVVMDEAFDMWKKKKTTYDYALNWDEWHRRDLSDMVLRDRNHPSIFIWSIGNEVIEQWDKNDSSGTVIARELAATVRSLDPTRPITSALNDQDTLNPVIRSGALDLIGYNYAHNSFPQFLKVYPGKKFIASETTSALATRGHYDLPSDSIRIWPIKWDIPFTTGNADLTCSSYDNCHVPWGSTHEETWKIIKKYDFLSGMYIWTGFDYLGEPTPYDWPARSSYFGIVDLAGFPKDAYYFYQSEWTTTPVLHLFPHWNWNGGDTIDVWAYTNCDEVELLLNGKSAGVQRKTEDQLHLRWRLPYTPGALKAVGRTAGKEVLVREIRTAGLPAKVALEVDRKAIAADGWDLAFVTIRVLDSVGTVVPLADNLVHFSTSGEGRIVGVDNGLQTSTEPFKANERKAYNGLCLAVIQSTEKAGRIVLTAKSDGLQESSIIIETK